MPVSSRSFSSFIFLLAGISALLVLIAVVLTGGFAIDAGPLHLSARRWQRPLTIAVLALGIAVLHGRESFSAAAAALSRRVDRHASSIAIVLASAAAAAGVGFGTYAAPNSEMKSACGCSIP